MATLSEILAVHEKLEPRHRLALQWFLDHEGQLVHWPDALSDGTILATRAKGIYKPEWSRYALSVRQAIGGPYPDLDIQTLPDGSWLYKYFQEHLDVEMGGSSFTNRGLRECMRDAVPVGVLIQKKLKPNAEYLVQGLAFVDGWDEGYFSLSGVRSRDLVLERLALPNEGSATPSQIADSIGRGFDPRFLDDERRKVVRGVVQRQGQPGFRRVLLDAYGSMCVATEYDASDALEAAHILPYRGPLTNHHSNGLLFRSDIHSLFDLGMLAVHESDLCLILAPELRHTRYGQLHGRRIASPRPGFEPPSREALGRHRQLAGL